MAKTIIQKITRENRIVTEAKPLEKKEVPQRIKVQNIKREIIKIPSFSSTNLLSQIKSFTQQRDKDYYLGFGGLGDALLLLATCWQNSKARVVFFANQIPFIHSFFELLNVPVYIHDNIMGTKMAEHIYEYIKSLPSFKESAHLADRLDFNDWKNEQKYTPRIRRKTNWMEHFGKKESDKPVVIIAPSGSHKDLKRQRYLNSEEYKNLVKNYLNKGYKIYTTGSMNDLHYFGLIDDDNFFWLTSDKIIDKRGMKSSNLHDMLRIINSAEHVISMDTWLKTYTLLCDIPTTVIETRWDGNYRDYGEDITDRIFLNKNIWPKLKLVKITDLLSS